MKNRVKRVIITLTIILLCASIFAVFVVLPVGNNNSLLWEILPHQPGSLPKPWMLPRADQTDIGDTVTISLPQMLDAAQFDDQDPLNPDGAEKLHIVYIYNSVEQTGRLVVITEVEGNTQACCLTLYEPEWVGGEAFFSNLSKTFQARIIHRVNIAWMEGMPYFDGMLYEYEKEYPYAVVDIPAYEDTSRENNLYFCGCISYAEGDGEFLLQENVAAKFLCCELSQADCVNDLIMSIVERYNLDKYLYL